MAFFTLCFIIQIRLKASTKTVFFSPYNSGLKSCLSSGKPCRALPACEVGFQTLRQQLPLLTERYGVETLEVFGSYVRAEQKADSDLDVLVTLREAPSLLTFIAIENYLSDTLGVKVDLVMKDSLRPAIGALILNEAVRL